MLQSKLFADSIVGAEALMEEEAHMEAEAMADTLVAAVMGAADTEVRSRIDISSYCAVLTSIGIRPS